MENSNKTVFISGASSGIGKATAFEFAKNGYRLILAGRRREKLEEIAAELNKTFAIDVTILSFDVRKNDEVQKSVDTLSHEWSEIDILINNAGLAKGLSSIHEGEIDHWETMLDTNVKGLLFLTRCIAPKMVARKEGHILNVGSTASHEVYPKGNVYCASKFAVKALTKAMRLDMHQYGIRVSQVSPGHVEDTEFAINRFDGDKEKANIYADFIPLNAKDVAEIIYFIASRKKHINIEDVIVMGTQQASSVFIDRSGR